jgi:hypothetical protein
VLHISIFAASFAVRLGIADQGVVSLKGQLSRKLLHPLYHQMIGRRQEDKMRKVEAIAIRMITLLMFVSIFMSYGESAPSFRLSDSPKATHSTAQADTTRPTCRFAAFRAGPPIAVDLVAQDFESGISTINVLNPQNVTVSVGVFTPGTTSPVTVTATKVDNTQVSSFELQITDRAGNVTTCELDQFPNSKAQVSITNPSDTANLSGPVTILVDIGRLADVDNRCTNPGGPQGPNGLEEVPSEIVQMELTGTSSMGASIIVRLRPFTKHPFMHSTGEIEETANTQPGRLDVPPFAPSGTACSFFDVFYEVQINGGAILHTDTPKHMQTTISHKPPLEQDIYLNTGTPQEMLFEDETHSGIFIGPAFHAPCGTGSPPTSAVTGTGTDAQGRKYVQITVRDSDSGLATINITAAQNATVSVPSFTTGTKDPVVITATKIDQTQSSTIVVQSIDRCGNVSENDPTMVEVVREAGKPVSQTFVEIPKAENRVDVFNGDPGVTNLSINVNGKTFELAGLRQNERRTLNVSSAMRNGSNTVTITARGAPGGAALVLISDNK